MKYQKFLPLVILVLLASTLAAQQPSPTPPDDQVVRISTDLIQIDVTVTDKNGKVVTDLRPEDFELFENGEKQNVSGFSFISRVAGSATVTDNNAELSKAPLLGSPQQLKREAVRNTIAIVVDDLNMSFASVYYLRKALKRFVDQQMQPGDLVAILRTGGGVGALQQFTADKRLLNAAIDKIRWNPLGASGIDSLSSVAQTNEEMSERFQRESDGIAGGMSKQRTSILTRENISDKKRTDYEVSKNASAQEEGIYAQASLGALRIWLVSLRTFGAKLQLTNSRVSVGYRAMI